MVMLRQIVQQHFLTPQGIPRSDEKSPGCSALPLTSWICLENLQWKWKHRKLPEPPALCSPSSFSLNFHCAMVSCCHCS